MNSMRRVLALLISAVLLLTACAVFAVSAEEGEAAYISEGMVAWYDGVDNEATGTHNNDATVWQNKINPPRSGPST